MISHIDDDHIRGILEMTKELIADLDDRRPRFLDVRHLWHNSFDEIIGNTPDDLLASISAKFGTASFGASVPEHPDLTKDAGKILASVSQGYQLRNDAKKLGWPINKPFSSLVMAQTQVESVAPCLGPDLHLTVLGPGSDQIKDLQEKYDKWLEDTGNGRREPAAALAAFSDTSVTNLSSLVILIRSEEKKILLTGDARGDSIMDALSKCELNTHGQPFFVDILKVPHHGSDRNVTIDFFEAIVADHYVFSGNGEHGNPERATMEMLFEARPEGGFTIDLTYPVRAIDSERRKNLEAKGKAWKYKQHSLEELYNKKRSEDVNFNVNCPVARKALILDLMESYPF